MRLCLLTSGNLGRTVRLSAHTGTLQLQPEAADLEDKNTCYGDNRSR